MMNAVVLIVEDEPEIATILQAYLEREGFRTVRAENGRLAIDLHLSLKPDIVLLDVKLPAIDGYAVLGVIRRQHNTPVIMVTALGEDLDKLQALRIGADDYVVKPFNAHEVVARVKAVLRRTLGHGETEVVRFGPISVDLIAHSAVVASGSGAVHLDLTLTEFRVLGHMIRMPTRAFTRAELVDACIPESETLERTIDTHVSNLRRKLSAAGAVGYPQSIRGVGYRLSPSR
ncbi:response regulator transcription factor [Enhydrobacter aerosaccus]|nr:response regulator transcription factor [Enhydrobacter aerosaccus]